MAHGVQRRLSQTVLRLRSINPDNVAEASLSVLSALYAQELEPTVKYQPVWNWAQRQPSTPHARTLVTRLVQHTWRAGVALAPSCLQTSLDMSHSGFRLALRANVCCATSGLDLATTRSRHVLLLTIQCDSHSQTSTP